MVSEESPDRDETPRKTCTNCVFANNFKTRHFKSLCYPMMPYICCIWSFPQSRSLVSSPPCPCQICRRTKERSCWTFLCWQKRRWNSKLKASAPLVIPWRGRVLVLNKFKTGYTIQKCTIERVNSGSPFSLLTRGKALETVPVSSVLRHTLSSPERAQHRTQVENRSLQKRKTLAKKSLNRHIGYILPSICISSRPKGWKTSNNLQQH